MVRTPIAALLAAGLAAACAVKSQPIVLAPPPAPDVLAEFWAEPADLAGRDLYLGPFGAELPGRWQGLEDLLRAYLPALAAEQRWSINGGDTWLVRLRARLAKWRLCPAFGWFDIHARLGPAGAGVVLPQTPLGTA